MKIHRNIPLNVEDNVNVLLKKIEKFYIILSQKHFKSAYCGKILNLSCILFNNKYILINLNSYICTIHAKIKTNRSLNNF
jgi:hypothetical protein